MNPFVAFDLTRIVLAPFQRTPRGIDRVDAGLARYFLGAWPGGCAATIPTANGVRCIARNDALRIVDAAECEWGENRDAADDPEWLRVKAWLLGRAPRESPRAGVAPNWLKLTGAAMQVARNSRYFFGPRAAAALPQGALYVNVGQLGIAVPRLLRWLDRRPDIKPLFMLHDTIPIDYAEYVPLASRHYHRQMLANAARYAAGLIVTTRAAEAAIRGALRRLDCPEIPCLAEPLPVSSQFAQGPALDPELAAVPYFVIAGSIEPRKNHLLILNLWRELVSRQGNSAPKLVVAGNRWRQYGAIADILERSEALRPYVIEASGLSTPALRQLIGNARALLMPSFAEGFGLPIVEALALGTPAIASDLPAHREAGGIHATYLHPIDGLGWLAAIEAHVRDGSAFRRQAAGSTVRTWTDYCRRIESFVLTVDAQGARRPIAAGRAAPTDAAQGA